ncbi:hypothetical protein ACWEKM_05555 [Streptomyces sp. NPDC004752]
MSARGGVFLGDLVKAVSLLNAWDPKTALSIAHLLGMGSRLTERPVPGDLPAQSPADGEAAPATREDGKPRAAGPVGPPVAAVTGHLPSDGADAVAGDAVPVPNEQFEPPTPAPTLERQWSPAPKLTERPLSFSLALTRPPVGDTVREAPAATEDGADDAPGETGVDSREHAWEPPWSPEWARGVMVAAVSAPVASRRIDQRALVRGVSRQQVLRAVPWQRRPSTRRGVQLLLDHGAAMAPFRDDRRWLHGLMGSVAGRDRIEVLRFTGSPSRGVVRADSVVQEVYRAPAPGTPVVLVSDLGKVRPPFSGDATARFDEWVDFVDRALRCGCLPVCLTPFPAAAYPVSVRERVALIPFDRRISLRHAQEATRRIHRLLETRS